MRIEDRSVDFNEGADGGRYFVFVGDAVATDNPGAQAGQIRNVVLSAPVGQITPFPSSLSFLFISCDEPEFGGCPSILIGSVEVGSSIA